MRVVGFVFLLLAALGGWALATGRVARILLAVQVLDDLRRPGPSSWLRRATPAPSRTPLALATAAGPMAADLYRGAGPAGTALVLVPGLVEQGKDDPRVPPFAELLARAGFTVVVPDLPSFRALRAHPDNLRDLGAAFDAVAARRDLAPAGTAGLFGISYAGGIALLAALDPARAERVRFVAAAGAYADLDSTLRYLATGFVHHAGVRRRVPPGPYGKLVFLRTYEDFIQDRRDRVRLEAMAQRRIRDPGAPLDDLARSLGPEGRLIYDLFETAPPESVPTLIDRLPEGLRRRMAELSPGRRGFESLRARLYLVHDRDDETFPVGEAHRLAAQTRGRVPVRLVVLETLQHVEPRPWSRDPWGFVTRDLPEAGRLALWWYALLGERGT